MVQPACLHNLLVPLRQFSVQTQPLDGFQDFAKQATLLLLMPTIRVAQELQVPLPPWLVELLAVIVFLNWATPLAAPRLDFLLLVFHIQVAFAEQERQRLPMPLPLHSLYCLLHHLLALQRFVLCCIFFVAGHCQKVSERGQVLRESVA